MTTLAHDPDAEPLRADAILPGEVVADRRTAPHVPVTTTNAATMRLDQRIHLTDHVHEQIILAARAGSSMREAAGFASVNYETLQLWLRRGRDFLLHVATMEERGEDSDDWRAEHWREEPYARLRRAYENALPQGVIRARSTVRSIMTDEEVPPGVRLKAAQFIILSHEARERMGLDDPDLVDATATVRDIDEMSMRLAESLEARKDRILEAVSRDITPDPEPDDYDPWSPWAPPIEGTG